MKIIIRRVFIMFLFFLFISQVCGSSSLILSTESIFPSTVKPGNDVVVELKLNNPNNENVNIDTIDIDLKDNFLLINKDYDQNEICPNCIRSLIYYLQSKPGIESGIYPIEIEVKYDAIHSVKEEILLKVVGEPNLVMIPKIDGEVYAGNTFNIIFNITNFGTNDAKNIKLFSDSNEIGFLEKSQLYLDEIKQKESKSIAGILISAEDISTGYYQVPFNIKYEDNQNNKYEIQENIGINILNKANVVIQNLKTPAQIIVNKEFELNLRLENDGYGDAKNVRAEILGDFEGNKKAFFGTLDRKGDLAYFFNLIPVNEGKNDIEIVVTYEDDYGKHEISESYVIDVMSASGYTLYYIIGGVLIVIVILILLLINHNKVE